MNLAYFRKSTYSVEETVKNVLEQAKKGGWKMLGTVDFPNNSGKMVLICRPEWVKEVLEYDTDIVGFLPCTISVLKKGDDILIGTGQPGVIKAITQNKNLAQLVTIAEKQLKDLIHASAGVKELHPTHVKLYSTTTCPYCKMEKAWLDENKIKHDLIYVDRDHEEAQKMVEKTGQMGVPVTEVQFDEGDPEYIIGFDQPKLAEMLGL